MQGGSAEAFSRRDLLSLIGTVAGSAAMYHAMTSLGFAADSTYQGPIELSGDVRGASVLILGAGLAGMTAALKTVTLHANQSEWASTFGKAPADELLKAMLVINALPDQ